MGKKQQEKILNNFNKLKIKLHLKLNENSEENGSSYEENFYLTILRKENKNLINLINYFKVEDETIEKDLDGKRLTRNKFKRILTEKLYNSVESSTLVEYLLFLASGLEEATIPIANFTVYQRYVDYLKTFVDCLKRAYEDVFASGVKILKVEIVE